MRCGVESLPEPPIGACVGQRFGVSLTAVSAQQHVRRSLALLGLFFTLAWIVPAAAEQTQALDAIRKRMEDGLGLFVSGKTEQAIAEFEAGYAQHPYSAFLFNAGVCYEKLNRPAEALAKYEEYLKVDPQAPDIADVERRVQRLRGLAAGGGLEAAPEPPAAEVDQSAMRSLVVIETEPPGAPVRVFRPIGASPPPYRLGADNPSWTEIVTTTAPTSLSLGVGLYHIVVDAFRDFNASDTQLRVSPGHVHHFKANLSQGVFMAFLRVSSNVKGAYIWLDRVDKSKPEWGTTPYGELVPVGEHEIFVEAPGFEPSRAKVTLDGGERREVQIELSRVDYGFLRIDAGDAPDATVTVDGKPQGRWSQGGPPLDVRLSAGPHRVLVESDGRKDYEATVEVPRGQILPLRVRLIPKYPRGAAWTQAIISAGLVGTGIVLGAESESIKDDLSEQRRMGTLEAGDSRISKGRWFAISADAAFVAGGVLAGLATWNFLKDPLPESSSKLDVPLEFDDPLSKRPTGGSLSRGPVVPDRAPSHASARFRVSAGFDPDVAGVVIGGSF